jgi:hypothetical protein
MITIMTVDEFMPVVTTPPVQAGAPTASEATIAPDGSSITFAANAQWMIGDAVADTPPIMVGDLVLFVGQDGNAMQTVTAVGATSITFTPGDPNDFFRFNQPNATNQLAGTGRPLSAVKQVGLTLCNPPVVQTPATVWCAPVTLFKALMITYYVDNTTVPGTPRLTRIVNHGTPQALAGVVEALTLTYDLYDGTVNPTAVQSLPTVLGGVAYDENMIRKVNLDVGVRSDILSKPLQDYVRNHITTAVNVRSLAAVSRYVTQ